MTTSFSVTGEERAVRIKLGRILVALGHVVTYDRLIHLVNAPVLCVANYPVCVDCQCIYIVQQLNPTGSGLAATERYFMAHQIIMSDVGVNCFFIDSYSGAMSVVHEKMHGLGSDPMGQILVDLALDCGFLAVITYGGTAKGKVEYAKQQKQQHLDSSGSSSSNADNGVHPLSKKRCGPPIASSTTKQQRVFSYDAVHPTIFCMRTWNNTTTIGNYAIHYDDIVAELVGIFGGHYSSRRMTTFIGNDLHVVFDSGNNIPPIYIVLHKLAEGERMTGVNNYFESLPPSVQSLGRSYSIVSMEDAKSYYEQHSHLKPDHISVVKAILSRFGQNGNTLTICYQPSNQLLLT